LQASASADAESPGSARNSSGTPLPAKAGLTGGLLKPDNRHEGGAHSAAFSLRLAEPRSISLPLIAIGGCCHEDRPSGRWPASYCYWDFLLCTRDGIAPMAAQFSDGRLRRRRRSRRYQPCLVRMAVSARAHLGVMPGLGWVVIWHPPAGQAMNRYRGTQAEFQFSIVAPHTAHSKLLISRASAMRSLRS
jgi:hypothetical protein